MTDTVNFDLIVFKYKQNIMERLREKTKVDFSLSIEISGEETWSENPSDIINFEPDNYIELGELPPPYMPN